MLSALLLYQTSNSAAPFSYIWIFFLPPHICMKSLMCYSPHAHTSMLTLTNRPQTHTLFFDPFKFQGKSNDSHIFPQTPSFPDRATLADDSCRLLLKWVTVVRNGSAVVECTVESAIVFRFIFSHGECNRETHEDVVWVGHGRERFNPQAEYNIHYVCVECVCVWGQGWEHADWVTTIPCWFSDPVQHKSCACKIPLRIITNNN